MRVVSKFSAYYFASGVWLLGLPLLILFMTLFATREETFEFEKQKIIIFAIISIVSTAIYVFFRKFIRMTCTEKSIYYKNLITQITIIINYDDIAEIRKKFKLNESGGGKYSSYRSSKVQWDDTSMKSRQIVMKNGMVFEFNDFAYKNFEEIEKFILENYNKTKGISINLPHNDIENVFSKAKFRSMIETSSSIFKNAKQ